ncbi:hypothetical protein D039_1434B, partial [Vibrio parahaemolyticus EKP-028]
VQRFETQLFQLSFDIVNTKTMS